MDHRILSKRKAEVFRQLYNELKDRERGSKRCKKSTGVRHMYTHITPNHTLYDVAIPLECQHIRRFTSDGKYLITFTPCYHGIRLYNFVNAVYTPANASEVSTQRDFSYFFKLKYLTMLTMPNGHELNVDFCLITKDQKFMILNSVGPWDSLSRSSAPIALDITIPLSDFGFYTVNIETGELVDQHFFHGDYIHVVDHAGVSLYENQFAVLSVQTQTIHVFQINESGKFHLLQSLGTFLRNDDASIVAMQASEEQHYRELQETILASDSLSHIPRDDVDQYISVLPVDIIFENSYAIGELQNMLESDTASLLTDEQLRDLVESANDSHLTEEIESQILQENPGFMLQETDNHSDNDIILQYDTSSSLEGWGSTSSMLETNLYDRLSQDTGDYFNEDQKLSLYSGFTQCMLSFLYKLFIGQAREFGRQYFFNNYNWFTSLKMWRMQFIGHNKLLIKLTRMPPEFTLLRSNGRDIAPPEAERTMFVIFDLSESRIIDMFESCSVKVKELMLESAYALRNVTPAAPYDSTPGMSEAEQEYFKRKVEYWSRPDKGGCHELAMQKLALYLPRQPYAQPQCPYFDLSLFRYPEKMIAFQNWTRTTLHSMNFYCKETNLLRFKLDAQNSSEDSTQAPLTLTMTIPNPRFPFIITKRVVPSINETKNVNFHVYV